MRPIPIETRQKAIALRQTKRLSLQDIADKVGISRTSVSKIVRDYPLTKEEIECIWHSKVDGKKRLAFDLTNKKFGRLIAIRPDYTPRKKHDTFWLCVCECGKKRFATSYRLRHGLTKSCGCLNTEQLRAQRHKPPRQTNIHSLFLGYKQGAGGRGIHFELTENDCVKLFEQDCYYCGTPPSKERKVHKNQDMIGRKHGFLWNGIDRKDSNLGYTLANCVSCCTRCNYAKRDISESEFVLWLDQATLYRFSLKGENDGV